MKVEVYVLDGRDTPYEWGKRQGEQLKSTKLYDVHYKRRPRTRKSYYTDILETRKLVEQFSAAVWDELEGLADGLGWALEDVIHEYSGYQQDWKKSGCSALMMDGLYGRNYDYHPKTYDGRFLLYQGTKSYASIGFAQRIIGRMDGMNEKGLAIGYHFVNRVKPSNGFICCSIARFVLDTCADVGDAINLMREIPHRHAFNYSMTDKKGNSVIIEASGKGVEINQQQLACTNHFVSPQKQIENRHKLAESIERQHNLENVSKHILQGKDMFYFLNSTTYPIFKKEYRNWAGTIHTAVYDTKTLTAHIGIGANALPVTFSFEEWMNGRKNIIKKLKGTLPGAEEVQHLIQ